MKPKFIFVLLIAITTLLACGTSSPSSPPSIELNVDGVLMSGLQGAYCWDQGIGGTVCVDPIEPMFDHAIPLPANSPIKLELAAPLPDTLVLSLSNEVFGDIVFSDIVNVDDVVEWSPPVAPGEYILTASGGWEQGDVTYWFSISLP